MSQAEEMGRGSWVLVVPVLSLVVVAAAAIGWVVAVRMGGEAKGEKLTIRLEGECAHEAKTAISTRLDDYGLAHTLSSPEPGVLLVETQTPGFPDDAVTLPKALTQVGKFEVWQNGAVKLTHFADAGVQLSLMGSAVSLITLSESIVPEGVEVRIDGQVMEIESINGEELMLVAGGASAQEALRTATDRVVAIRHPLPCGLKAG